MGRKTLADCARVVAIAERRVLELLVDALRDDFVEVYTDMDVRRSAWMRQGPPSSG